MTTPLVIGLAGVVGSCIGSYSATLGLRMARGEPAMLGRSACDSCGVALGFARTVPLISFIQSGGGCYACGGRIDRVHVAGEVLGAAIAIAAALATPPERGVLIALIGFTLLTAAIIDQKTQRLPHLLTMMIALGALALTATSGLPALVVGLASAVVTFALLEAVRWTLGRLKGGGVLGGGDVLLLSGLAIWLGPATPWALVLASISGLIVARVRNAPMGRTAFGPYLASAAWLIGAWLELTR